MTEPGIAALACPSCSAPIVAGDLFCEACGHQLPAAGEPCPGCGDGRAVDGYCAACGLRQPGARDRIEHGEPGIGIVTDKGLRHHRNEDAFAHASTPGAVLAVVADGVSMTTRPDEASQAAVDAAVAVLSAAVTAAVTAPTAADLDAAYDAAVAAVRAVPVEPHPELGPPSCTFLAGVVTDAEVRLAGLGDCRAYWVGADGAAEQLTADDRVLDSADHAASTITRWLAVDAEPTWRPALSRFAPPGPGHVLLVSDGLWSYTATPADLVAAMGARTDDPLTIADRLVAHALAGGGHDNITVVVILLPIEGAAP